MAEIAAVLGKSDDAKRFRQDFKAPVRAAYQKAHFERQGASVCADQPGR